MLSKSKFLIFTAIALSVCALSVLSDDSDAVSYTGNCGVDLSWTLDTETQELTISGSGTAMADYEYQDAAINPNLPPWMQYSSDIRFVMFDTPNLLKIGNGAFKNMGDLEYVLMPEKLEEIGYSAFANCTSMSISYMPNTLKTVKDRAFYNCTSVGGMNFPQGLESVGAYGFAFHDSRFYLTKLPDTLTEIGSHAFEGWSMNWGVVQLPNTTVNIYQNAFESTNGCDSVYLPPNFKLGPHSYNSFVGMNPKTIYNYSTNYTLTLGADTCGSIAKNTSATKLIQQTNSGTLGSNFNWTYVSANNTLRIYGNGTSTPEIKEYNPSASQMMAVPWFGYINDIKAVDWNTPNLVTLGNSLFSNHTALESIVIPQSVTKIGNEMFNGCTALKSVEFANPNPTIGNSLFRGCTALETVKLPMSMTKIPSQLFSGCSNLVSVEMPNTITVIEDWAFNGCTKLDMEKLPSALTSIGANAFNNCKALSLTELPNSVTTIGNSAFSNCTNLALVKLPSGLVIINDYAFSGCTKNAISEIPSSVTSIGRSAFSNNLGITVMKIPQGIGTVQSSAFAYCRNLATVINESSFSITPGSAVCGGVGQFADAVIIPELAIQKVDYEKKIDEPYVNLLLVIPTFIIIGIVLVILSYVGIRRGSLGGGSEYDRI